jgi:hypothetical protein
MDRNITYHNLQAPAGSERALNAGVSASIDYYDNLRSTIGKYEELYGAENIAAFREELASREQLIKNDTPGTGGFLDRALEWFNGDPLSNSLKLLNTIVSPGETLLKEAVAGGYKEGEEFISQTQVKNPDYNWPELLHDMALSFLDEQDNLTVSSYQGELVYNILPKMDEANAVKEHAEQLKLAQQLNAQWEQTRDTEIYKQLQEVSSNLNASLYTYNNSDITKDTNNPDEVITKADNKLTELAEEQATALKHIENARNDIKDRINNDSAYINGMVSEYYKAKQEQTPIGIFDPQTWIYQLPKLAGGSMSFIEPQLASTVSTTVGSWLLSAAGRQILTKVAPRAMANPYGAAAAGIAGAVLIGVGIHQTIKARELETYAEISEAYSRKVGAQLEEKTGIPYEQLVNHGRNWLANNYEDAEFAKTFTDEQIFNMMLTSEIPVNHAGFNQLRREERKNLDDMYWSNMALAIPDFAENLIILPYAGKLVGAAIKAPMKLATKLATPIANATTRRLGNYIIDNTIKIGTKIMPKLMKSGNNLRAFGNTLGSFALKTGAVMAMEANEESSQYLVQRNFVNGRAREDSNLLTGVLDNVGYTVQGIANVLGIGDPEVMNDKEYWDSVKGGALLGGLLGGTFSAVSSMSQFNNQLKANKFIRELTAQQLLDADILTKAKIYAQASPKRAAAILQTLEWEKGKLERGRFTSPTNEGADTIEDTDDQGISSLHNWSAQDFTEEIERANSVFRVANSAHTQTLAKELGEKYSPFKKKYDRDSDEFATIVGFTQLTAERVKREADTNKQLQTDYYAQLNTPEWQKAVSDQAEQLLPNGTTAQKSELAGLLNTRARAQLELQQLRRLESFIEQNVTDADRLRNEVGYRVDAQTTNQYLERLRGRIKAVEQLLNVTVKDGIQEFNTRINGTKNNDPAITDAINKLEQRIANKETTISTLQSRESIPVIESSIKQYQKDLAKLNKQLVNLRAKQEPFTANIVDTLDAIESTKAPTINNNAANAFNSLTISDLALGMLSDVHNAFIGIHTTDKGWLPIIDPTTNMMRWTEGGVKKAYGQATDTEKADMLKLVERTIRGYYDRMTANNKVAKDIVEAIADAANPNNNNLSPTPSDTISTTTDKLPAGTITEPDDNLKPDQTDHEPVDSGTPGWLSDLLGETDTSTTKPSPDTTTQTKPDTPKTEPTKTDQTSTTPTEPHTVVKLDNGQPIDSNLPTDPTPSIDNTDTGLDSSADHITPTDPVYAPPPPKPPTDTNDTSSNEGETDDTPDGLTPTNKPNLDQPDDNVTFDPDDFESNLTVDPESSPFAGKKYDSKSPEDIVREIETENAKKDKKDGVKPGMPEPKSDKDTTDDEIDELVRQKNNPQPEDQITNANKKTKKDARELDLRYEDVNEQSTKQLNWKLDYNKNVLPPGIGDGKTFDGVGVKRGAFGKLNSTFFYHHTEKGSKLNAAEYDVEDGKEFGKMLGDPNNHPHLDCWIEVNRKLYTRNPGESIVLYVRNKKTGKLYAGILRTEKTAYEWYRELVYGRTGLDTTQKNELWANLKPQIDADIAKLIANRKRIVALYNDPSRNGRKLRPNLSYSNGTFNNAVDDQGNPVFRPLNEIKGFGFPKDLRDVETAISKDGNLPIGIGKGARDEYIIFADDGSIMPGKGAQGAIYLYVKDTPSGRNSEGIPVKVSGQRFSNAKNGNAIIDAIINFMINLNSSTSMYNTQIGNLNVSTGVTINDIVNLMVRNDKSTLLNEEEFLNYPFLRDKQLFYDSANNTLYYGNNPNTNKPYTATRNEILNNVGGAKDKFKAYLLQHHHFRMNKENLWERLGSAFPGLKTMMQKFNLDSFALVPNVLEFTLEDVGLTRSKEGSIVEDNNHPDGTSFVSWLIKNGKLESDLNDQVFINPFVYSSDVSYDNSDFNDSGDFNENGELTTDTGDEVIAGFDENDNPIIRETSNVNSTPIPPINNNTTPNIDNVIADTPIDNEPPVKQSLTVPDEFDNDRFDSLFGFTRRVPPATKTSKISTAQENKAKQWLMDKLGLTEDEVEFMDEVIFMAQDGTRVVGLCRADGITLSRLATPGTEYHEAFHRVNQLIHTEEERQRIYAQYRNKHNLTNIDDLTLEELLAEDYREWKISGRRQLGYRILKAFKRIFSFSQAIQRLGNTDIADIYSKISEGYYANIKPTAEATARFQSLYKGMGAPFTMPSIDGKPTNLNTITTSNAVTEAIESIRSFTLMVAKIESPSDVTNIDNNLGGRLFKAILSYRNSINQNLTPKQIAVLDEILEKFDSFFWPQVKHSFIQLGVKAIDANKEEEISEVEGGGIKFTDKANYKLSRKDNASFRTKFLIATTGRVKREYRTNKDGVMSEVIVPVKSSVTGLPSFFTLDEVYNNLLADFHNYAYDVNVFRARLQQLSSTNDFYLALNNRFNKNDKAIAEGREPIISERAETELLQLLNSNDNNFNYIAFRHDRSNKNSTYIYYVNDSSTRRAAKTIPLQWSNSFYYGDMFKHDGDQVTPNTEAIKQWIDNYKVLANNVLRDINKKALDDKSLADYKIELVKLLTQIGINIDVETLNKALTLIPEFANLDKYSQFSQLLNNTKPQQLRAFVNSRLIKLTIPGETLTQIRKGKVEIKPFHEAFNNEYIIGKFAEAQATVHSSSNESSVLSADNNKAYKYSQNNMISDTIRALNSEVDGFKYNEYVDKLLGTTYNKSSLILNAIKNGRKLTLHTFSTMIEEGTSDTGREYTGLTVIEDFLAKMTYLRNDFLILPTLADKATYYTIRGAKLFHKPISISPDGKSVQLDTSILFHFDEYLKSEWEAIKDFYLDSTVDNAGKVTWAFDHKRKRSIRDTIKNYHTNKRGGRFRTLLNVELIRPDGSIDTTDVNTFLDEAEKSGDILAALAYVEKQLFSVKNNVDSAAEYRMQLINTNLKRVIQQTLNEAAELGIIGRREDDSRLFYNKLLDKVAYDNKVNEYKNSNQPELSTNFGHYAVYDLIADMVVNSIVSNIEFTKVFSGDMAMYKTPDDYIKRLGGAISTGDNLRTVWRRGHRLEHRQTYSTVEIADNMISTNQEQVVLDMFEESFMIDIVINTYGYTTNKQYNDHLVRIEKNPESTEAKEFADLKLMAIVRAKQEIVPYINNNINSADGSVYISPQMYYDLMQMLGKWDDTIQEAFDIVESDDAWQTDPIKAREAAKLLLYPLKMTSFNHIFDDVNKVMIPVYDKMALFPVFKMFAQGDNRELYDRMTGKGNYQGSSPIDMVKTNSAVKVGSRAIGKFYTNGSMSELADLSKWEIYNQSFGELRMQLNTAPHDSHEQLFGTQVAKGAMANIRRNWRYGLNNKHSLKLTGAELINEIFGSMAALSDIGASSFIDELGTVRGGVFIVDPNKLSKMLYEDAISTNMSYDILAGFTVNDQGQLTIPIDALSDSKFFESRIISALNKQAVDIRMPGGAYIQEAQFGFNNNVITISSSSYNKGRTLNLINNNVNDDGSTDCLISYNMLKSIVPDNIRNDYNKAREWLIEQHIIGDDANPTALGYRIPTQGVNSIAVLKIRDILPSNIGDVIILPDEWAALTGSDFSIEGSLNSLNCWEILLG